MNCKTGKIILLVLKFRIINSPYFYINKLRVWKNVYCVKEMMLIKRVHI